MESPEQEEQRRREEELRREERKVVSTEASKIQALARGVGGGTDNRRYVILAQLVCAGLVWWAVAQIFALVWQRAGLPPFSFLGLASGPDLAALVAVGGGLIYLFRNAVAQEFAMEVIVELRKVTWPTFKETRQTTLVVLVLVVLNAAILGGFDFLWAKLIKAILQWGAGGP